eukprot:CAMPEP_0178404348 /NCGR_PEP_ID=MMETSP0689_2-20121128/17836_1 /TAXON_ID=160604 /ORGANISM="Amphidinium massartii, Strain CS-259" /LENGTH=115 /DNA_ID=CAMNT_0020025327 /DNA_START=90 /DNA_END=434 /DNA_ORIENTATION=+
MTGKDTANQCTILVERGVVALRKDSPYTLQAPPAGSGVTDEQWQQIQSILAATFVANRGFPVGPPFGSDPHKDKVEECLSRMRSLCPTAAFTYKSFYDNYNLGGKCWCHCITVQW